MINDLLQIETSGKSIDQAVEAALQHFGCTRAEIDIDVLQTPSSGLLGLLFSKPALIRAVLKDRAFIAGMVCQTILDKSDLGGEVEVCPGSDQIVVDIRSEDPSTIIGRQGQTIDALQYLVVAATDRRGNDRTPISLDCDNHREKRRAFLLRLGRSLSSQVKKSGKPANVQPLPPQERRVLHLAIEEEQTLDIKSVGQGFERKMVISLRRG